MSLPLMTMLSRLGCADDRVSLQCFRLLDFSFSQPANNAWLRLECVGPGKPNMIGRSKMSDSVQKVDVCCEAGHPRAARVDY
jgi:hypothetical protein